MNPLVCMSVAVCRPHRLRNFATLFKNKPANVFCCPFRFFLKQEAWDPVKGFRLGLATLFCYNSTLFFGQLKIHYAKNEIRHAVSIVAGDHL
jgi:hypothetical protein